MPKAAVASGVGGTGTTRRNVRLSLINRLALAGAAVLLLASCGTLHQSTGDAEYSRPVLDTAFRNIDDRYVTKASLPDVAIAGLDAVVSAEPLAELSRRKDTISLVYNDMQLGGWAVPAAHDHGGWATLVAEALDRLRENSSNLQKAGVDAELALFFDGGLAKLDRYTRYSTPSQAVDTRARREGFGGIGINIRHTGNRIVITEVHRDTPAERAGLRVGDEIVRVGNVALRGLNEHEVIRHLRGPSHSTAELTIRRRGAPRLLEFSIVRAHIILQTVESRRDGRYLYIKISGFNQGTSRALGRALTTAEREGTSSLKGVILDLRANPGGLLDQAVAVSDFFLNDGRIISTRGRFLRANQIFDASWGERVRNLPIALLVNGRSASASEIVAAALRDRGRAVLVGTSSFGKGSVQTIIRLPNSGELTMTWAHLIAPSGFSLQGHGVIPAICTSAGNGEVAAMMKAVHGDTPSPVSVFADMLETRHSVLTDPVRARKECPPTSDLATRDVDIAKFVLANKQLYTRALVDGGPAIAEREE